MFFFEANSRHQDIYHEYATMNLIIDSIRLGSTQLKVPSVDNLQEAYEGKKIPKEEFQKLLQDVLIGAGFTGVGGIKEFLLFIFGVPAFAVFLKNRIGPTFIPNDLFTPAVTSATKYVFACEGIKEMLNIENLRALLVSLIFKAFIDLRT
ncbi:hypothetical protein YC2023_048271 [Brassica napus]